MRVEIPLSVQKLHFAFRNYTLRSEITLVRMFITICVSECYNYLRECHNRTHTCQHHTLRVEITLVRVEITVVVVVITFVRFNITLCLWKLEITLCLWKLHSACEHHNMCVNITLSVWASHYACVHLLQNNCWPFFLLILLIPRGPSSLWPLRPKAIGQSAPSSMTFFFF
jgi:hypothetical protein